MAQEYKIAHYDAGNKPFFDKNGNQWVSVLFEGNLSEPTKWVMQPKNVANYKVGDTVYGRIESPEGKNYQRFYRETKPDAPQASTGGSKPAYKDNSDGQRQGMCFNNAANYVNTKSNPAVVFHAQEWAKMVYEYANALYKLGDLGTGTQPEKPHTDNSPDPMQPVYDANPMNDGSPDLAEGW